MPHSVRRACGTGWSRMLPVRQGFPGRMRAAACHIALQAVGRSASVGQALDLLQDLGVWRLHEQRSLIKAGIVEHFPPEVMVRAAAQACSCAQTHCSPGSPQFKMRHGSVDFVHVPACSTVSRRTHVKRVSTQVVPGKALLAVPVLPALAAVTSSLAHRQAQQTKEGPARSCTALQEQARALELGAAPSDPDAAGRADLTDQVVFTIDDASTRDIDDGLSAEFLPDGRVRLWVHIADPTRFIALGSPLELEARHRTRTLYMPHGEHA